MTRNKAAGPRLLTPEQVADMLSIPVKAVKRLPREQLPRHSFGRLVRFAHEDVEALIAASRR